MKNYRTNVIPDANYDPHRRLYERNGKQHPDDVKIFQFLIATVVALCLFFCWSIETISAWNDEAPARAEHAYQVQQAVEAHERAATSARRRIYEHKCALYAFYHPNNPPFPPFDETRQP